MEQREPFYESPASWVLNIQQELREGDILGKACITHRKCGSYRNGTPGCLLFTHPTPGIKKSRLLGGVDLVYLSYEPAWLGVLESECLG